MKLNECFKRYKYKSLLSEAVDEKQKKLLNILFNNEERPDELKQIYLSDREDELFVILQVNKENVKELSHEWDAKILAVINFGENLGIDHSWIEKIKYNITQILLHKEEIENKDLEKSIDISRKIFLKCSADDELEDNEEVRLPFLYDEFRAAEINEEHNSELKNMLPDKKTFPFLYDLHERIDGRSVKAKEEQMIFSDEELELVKGWVKGE